MSRVARGVAGLAWCTLTGVLMAQSTQPDSRPVSLMETAADLARDGSARGDARAILAAARILEVVGGAISRAGERR